MMRCKDTGPGCSYIARKRCPRCKKVRAKWFHPNYLGSKRAMWQKHEGILVCHICAERLGLLPKIVGGPKIMLNVKLLVQEFLETKTFKDLQEQHGVYASFDKKGYKFSLNYDMIEVKDDDILAQECRGLILSEKTGLSFFDRAIDINGKLNYDHICPGETIIQSFPFRRFYNYGQGACANVNWNDPNLAILEKLDGSLISLYIDKITNIPFVSTRSVPEADVPLTSDNSFTFRTLFEKALFNTCGLSFEEFSSKLNDNYTYMFELTSPYTRIIVDYKETKITLLGARDLTTLKEIPLSKIDIGIPHVQAHAFTCVKDLVEWVSNQNPLEHEGVVVVDSSFNRIKMKNASYVAFNRARDILGTSERNCLELVLAGHDDDVIPAMPQEIVDRILKIKQGVVKFIKDYDDIYLELKSEADKTLLNDKKTFALLVKNNKDIWSAPMFTIFDGKAFDMKDFIFKNKKEGTWANNFLDKILNIISN